MARPVHRRPRCIQYICIYIYIFPPTRAPHIIQEGVYLLYQVCSFRCTPNVARIKLYTVRRHKSCRDQRRVHREPICYRFSADIFCFLIVLCISTAIRMVSTDTSRSQHSNVEVKIFKERNQFLLFFCYHFQLREKNQVNHPDIGHYPLPSTPSHLSFTPFTPLSDDIAISRDRRCLWCPWLDSTGHFHCETSDTSVLHAVLYRFLSRVLSSDRRTNYCILSFENSLGGS